MVRKKQALRGRLLKAAFVIVLLPLILPLGLLTLTLALLHRGTLWLLIQLVWLPRGKDVLLVYSDSPIWHDYMTKEIAPLVGERAVILNWSERRRWHWWSLAVRAFRSYGGGREFNPLVLLFRPLHRTRVFRLWSAFQNSKHGYTEPLERTKQELAVALR
jgi:hypothetical protein